MTTQSGGDPRGLAQRLMESPLVVAIYESRLWRRNPIVEALMGLSFDDELERISAAAHVHSTKRALDLACGSGIYTRRLAGRFTATHVVGLDISKPMLAYADRTARMAGLENLSLVRGSALQLPFPDASFEVVNCCGALHLFPDVSEALKEAHRVLVGGGHFAAAVIRTADSGAGRFAARQRLRHLGVYSFTRADLSQRLESAGFEEVEILHEGRIWMIAVGSKAI